MYVFTLCRSIYLPRKLYIGTSTPTVCRPEHVCVAIRLGDGSTVWGDVYNICRNCCHIMPLLCR